VATIREVEIRRYRLRLHRIVSLYLALRAWCRNVNCIVLSRSELLKFFDMESTPAARMAEIQKDMTPWFKGFKAYYRENDHTYVHWLFLSQSEDLSFLPPGSNLSTSSAVVRKLIDGSGSGATKVALLSDILEDGGIPTQKDMVAELALLTAGLRSPSASTKPSI
jgi:hypothetical protein